MKVLYLISFILLIITSINAQTSYNKIVNHNKVPSTVPLIAWGSKEINVFPILDTNLPSDMSIDFANTELNTAIATWSAEGNYTFTRNTGNDPDGNACEGVAIGFTINEEYFTIAGLDPKSTAGITFTALSKVAKNNYYIVYNNHDYPQFSHTFIVLNNTNAFLNLDPDLILVSYPISSGDCPGIFQDPVHLQSVLVHELGHILGLSHNNNNNSVMYPALMTCQMKTQLDYTDDDLDKLADVIDYGFPDNSCSPPPLWVRRNIKSKIVEQATKKGGK